MFDERDLACHDLWASSLARSRGRRGVRGWQPWRDLDDPEVWQRAAWRSRARREAAEQPSGLPVRGLGGAALVPVSAPTAVASAAPALERGDDGGRVSAVQRKLGLQGDGVFGPRTAHAVRAFQKRNGLKPDGIVGPLTLAKLRGGGGAGASGSAGSGGGGTHTLQRKLGIAADGVFGPQTARAVTRFQRVRGMTADGIVGPQTRAALKMGPGPVIKRRSAKRSSSSRAGGGGYSSKVSRIVSAANQIADKPYKYGGGHGQVNDSGYDCSGSVSYALIKAGLLETPRASGGFSSYGKPGKGKHVTIYSHSGHAFMVVNGRRFDTSARHQTGSRWSSTMRSTAGYTARHPAGL